MADDGNKPAGYAMGQPMQAPQIPVDAFARMEAPFFYGNHVQTIEANNDVIVVLGRPHPAFSVYGPEQKIGTGIEPQAILHLSYDTAKDLAILLNRAVAKRESEFGIIETELTRSDAKKAGTE